MKAQPNRLVGVARRIITPPPGVELAGLGYYLNRTWERIADHLAATALVITEEETSIAILAVDLMYNDAAFTRDIRRRVAEKTAFPAEAICVNCSHTHNAPTAGRILGAGEQHSGYLRWAAEQAAQACIEAWRKRQPAKLFVGMSRLDNMTFNRTRENGPVDETVSVLRAETMDGHPLAFAVNFHSHCTAHMEPNFHAVSRDWPGEVADNIEKEFPGATALYLQGTCGDVNFRREFNGTSRRFEPARALTAAVQDAVLRERPIESSGVAFATRAVHLSTRRWTRDEIFRERDEGLYRMKTADTTGWLDGVAKVCVNLPERLPLRYGGSVEKAVAAISRFAVEWTDEILPVVDTRPEFLETEVQALRIGDIYFAANAAELFTTQGMELRQSWPHKDLFALGFSNGSIGYLPDAYDVERRSYAAIQSPKCTGQFPFTAKSGKKMVNGLLASLEKTSQQPE